MQSNLHGGVYWLVALAIGATVLVGFGSNWYLAGATACGFAALYVMMELITYYTADRLLRVAKHVVEGLASVLGGEPDAATRAEIFRRIEQFELQKQVEKRIDRILG